MKAWDKFEIGQRVRLTKEGQVACPKTAHLGTVLGFSVEGDIVRVRVDKNKSAVSYHVDFWESHDEPAKG